MAAFKSLAVEPPRPPPNPPPKEGKPVEGAEGVSGAGVPVPGREGKRLPRSKDGREPEPPPKRELRRERSKLGALNWGTGIAEPVLARSRALKRIFGCIVAVVV